MELFEKIPKKNHHIFFERKKKSYEIYLLFIVYNFMFVWDQRVH
jgi:hypothetical protein